MRLEPIKAVDMILESLSGEDMRLELVSTKALRNALMFDILHSCNQIDGLEGYSYTFNIDTLNGVLAIEISKSSLGIEKPEIVYMSAISLVEGDVFNNLRRCERDLIILHEQNKGEF